MQYIGTAKGNEDLKGILDLQMENLSTQLSVQEQQSHGFVTVLHTLDQLVQLNDNEKHIVAKDENGIAGYILAMTDKSRKLVPILIPMFDVFQTMNYNGKPLSAFHYVVVGQVCIKKNYRGTGLLEKLYAEYHRHFSARFDLAITEIALTNSRSLNAHQRIGFKTNKVYKAPDGVEWVIVVWDWTDSDK